jgi:hypothetical protein
MSNAIDLTTLAAVKGWLSGTGQTPPANAQEDPIIQDAITAFSAWVLKQTGRGPADGSIPAASPFVTPQTYDEFYDGNGNDRLPLYNWPIVSVSSVKIWDVVIPQATGTQTPGWTIDQTKKFLVLRGAPLALSRGFYTGGYRAGWNAAGWSLGTQNVEVGYSAGFAAIPFDLEFMCRKVCGAMYKRKSFIGQKQQAMAQGAGTVTWVDWFLDDQDVKTMQFYQARAA